MNLINRIFNNNNESYTIAKSCLSRVKNKLDEFADVFPDVTPNELLYIKNQWNKLPNEVGVGVSVMALEIKEEYSKLLSHFEANGFILPHVHNDEFELNTIVRGSIRNKVTGEVFKTGDTFIIDKNENHYLYADEETDVYCLLTAKEELLATPDIKPAVMKHFNFFKPGK